WHGPEEELLSWYSRVRSLLTSKWTKVVLFLVCQQVDQGCPLPRLPDSAWRAHLARSSSGPWRQSCRVHSAPHRPVDSAFSGFHPVHHAFSQAPQPAGSHPFPPHARPLRLFLRLLALPHLSWPRSVFRSGCHVERCRQAPVHHSRVSRFSALGSTGHYFDGRLDSSSRRGALGGTASRPFFLGGCRGGSFFTGN